MRSALASKSTSRGWAMLEFLTRQGFTVRLTPGLVILTRKDAADLQWDYPTLRAAYDALGGPQSHIQYLGGRV
jgi:hypothetical protein